MLLALGFAAGADLLDFEFVAMLRNLVFVRAVTFLQFLQLRTFPDPGERYLVSFWKDTNVTPLERPPELVLNPIFDPVAVVLDQFKYI